MLEDYKMDKHIYNEQNGLWYELQGNYYLPCLKYPEKPEIHTSVSGDNDTCAI